MDRPTVPKAETHSKTGLEPYGVTTRSFGDKKNGSRKQNYNSAPHKRRNCLEYGIGSHGSISVDNRISPSLILKATRINIYSVTVLIPPPVEPGEAPMNIRIIVASWLEPRDSPAARYRNRMFSKLWIEKGRHNLRTLAHFLICVIMLQQIEDDRPSTISAAVVRKTTKE